MFSKFLKLTQILTLALLGWSPAYAESNFSITLDGVYNRVLSGAPRHMNAGGGSLLLEYHPADVFSIGAGLDILGYFGTDTPGDTFVESVNLAARFILNPGSPFTLYLMGEGGITPKLLKTQYNWPGDTRFMVGLGSWTFLSDHMALDFGVGYDLYPSPIQSIENVQGRLGLTFFLNNAQKKKSEPIPTAEASLSVPGAAPTPEPTPAAEPTALPTETTEAIPAPPAETQAASPKAVEMDVESVVANYKTGTIKKTTFKLNSEGRTDIKDWNLEVKDLQGTVLKRYKGTGVPPKQLVWNGRDSNGKLVPGAVSAVYQFNATGQDDVKFNSDGNLKDSYEPAPVESREEETDSQEPNAGLPPGTHGKIVDVRGYSLWEMAELVLGDPELYPILVDAYKKNLKPGRMLLPLGTQLALPDEITDAMKEGARLKAWTPAYTRFRGRGLSKMGYQRWRHDHGLSSTWKDPDYSGGKP